MNTLKMGPAGHAVSGPERSSRCPVDREAQHPRAALVIARDAREQPARATETSPSSQTRAKPRSFRMAIKVGGRILFINLGDVVSVQAQGKYVWPQGNAGVFANPRTAKRRSRHRLSSPSAASS